MNTPGETATNQTMEDTLASIETMLEDTSDALDDALEDLGMHIYEEMAESEMTTAQARELADRAKKILDAAIAQIALLG